ncbi:hypothetical protein AB0M20_38335 [Actinoplanes sp. NPDC051633]|uniref:hypothetical protein n=1 Tax=Actinoplanes sp. NPDC051633 TaxID=3155670 RepID=UPI003432AF6E
MDDATRTTEDATGTPSGLDRRAFFGRALLAVGAAATLATLTGCPGGDQGDDDDDGGDDDD